MGLRFKGTNIEIAGYLAPDIFTISGPKEEIEEFIKCFNMESEDK